MRVAVRKAIRDPLVAQTGLLELERLGRQAELQVRRAVEPGPEVLQILLEVPEREVNDTAAILRCSRYRFSMQSDPSLSMTTLCRFRVAADVRSVEGSLPLLCTSESAFRGFCFHEEQ